MNKPASELMMMLQIQSHTDVLGTYVESLAAPSQKDGIVFGTGEHRYRLEHHWAKLPDDWNLHDVVAVQVDKRDRVYVFTRGQSPVIVFDRDGNMLAEWGKGVFDHPHGAHLGPDDMLYCVDDGNHTVRKFALDGTLVMTLGTPGKGAPYLSGIPFSRPTDVALSPTGDLYISDGYFNAHVHKFSPDGRHLLTWGGSGIGPGEFNISHNIVCDADGWVYVADRENHRVQVFDGKGKFETQWNYLHRPCGLEQMPNGLFVVGELGPSTGTNRYASNLGPRVRILDQSGNVLVNLGDEPSGDGTDRFVAPHGLAVDSHGDIYVAEVSHTFWRTLFPKVPVPPKLRSIGKLVKLS